MKLVLALVSIVALLACSRVGPVLLPGDPPCVNACKVLVHFGCPEAQPSPGGKTCEQVCSIASAYSTQAECIVASESLESVRACAVKCEQR